MSEIFISYARKDEQFVSRLVSDLEREQRDVFYDRKLEAGQDFERVLSEKLQKAKFVLVVLSPNSLASSEVHKELQLALQRELGRRTVVVPLLITPCDPEKLAALIGKKYYANFTADYKIGFDELMSTLRKGSKKRMSFSLKEKGLGAAVITGIVTLIVAYWQFVYKPAHSESSEAVQYAARVTDASTQHAIRGAKVSVETQGAPQIYYSDSEGVFYVKLPGSLQVARIRVEANGYEPFDRNVSLQRTGVEEVPLAPIKASSSANENSSPDRSKRPGKKDRPDNINRILSSEPSNKPN